MQQIHVAPVTAAAQVVASLALVKVPRNKKASKKRINALKNGR